MEGFMYLSELRISGFKSFADRTILKLGKGVSAVVGPNGCGKSNIADAIRWALGEQSAKALRGGKMQDVIFIGNDKRKPLSLCEVTLVFSDCEAQLGTSFHQIEITRRVTRDGQGAYYLNGKASRLKDIHNLFMDTGIGRVSYSFMVQGQIDQILSNNPAERRTIFEEAAGITRYKAQRREALLKLEHVDTNLARVSDVLEEKGKRMASLKRQAAKALRYQKIEHRLRHLDLAHNSYHYLQMRGTAGLLEREVGELREKVEGRQEIISGIEASHEEVRARRQELSALLQESQQTVYNLRSEREQAQNQAEMATLRQTDFAERVTAMEKEIEDLEVQRDEISHRLQGEVEDKQMAMDLFDSSDQVFQQKSSEVGVIQKQLGEAESEFSRLRQQLLVQEGGITRSRSRSANLELELKTFEVKHGTLVEQRQTVQAELETLTERIEDIRIHRETREEELQYAQQEVQGYQDKNQSLRQEFRSLQESIQTQDRELARLTAQRHLLENLQEKLEGFGQGARNILGGKLNELLPAEQVRLLTRFLRVDEKYTRALEALLGPAAEALVWERETSELPELLQTMSDKKLGKVSFQLKKAGSASGESNAEIPGFLTAVQDLVQLEDESLRPWLDQLMEGAYFTEDLPSFLHFWEQHPEFRFSLVSSSNGEWVDARGLVTGGLDKSGAPDSFLQRQNSIRKLKQEAEELSGKVSQLQIRSEELQRAMNEVEEALETSRARTQEIQQEHHTSQQQEREAVQQQQRLQSQLDQAIQQLRDSEERKQQIELQHATSREELEKLEMSLEETRNRLEESEKRVEQLRGERDEKRDSMTDIRVDLATKKQRLETLDKALQQLEQSARNIEQLRIRRASELEHLQQQIVEEREKGEMAGERAAQLVESQEAAMEALEVRKTELLEVEKNSSRMEERLQEERRDIRQWEESLRKEELQLNTLQNQLQFLAEETQREYSLDVATLQWKDLLWKAGEAVPARIQIDMDDENAGEEEVQLAPPHDPTEEDYLALDATDWGLIKDEVKTLRGKVQSMGPVNLVAIEEYAELREEYDFLKAQSDDLWKAKEQLVATIDEINLTSRQQFEETFRQVQKNFEFTFQKLFGGGIAQLELIDSEDVLESGIDILAQPPGMKVRQLSLLSGGQKTMTAVALLFAIYMVKPSPFCLLDELDAPLDESNINRFIDLLKQFTQYSQFVLITHNKRTIAAADAIYGVTMPEKGVSKLLSMKFNQGTGRTEEVASA